MPHQLLDERLIGPFIRDLGALMHASTVLVGDRLGLLSGADSRGSRRRVGGPHRHHPVRRRVAGRPGGVGLRGVRPHKASGCRRNRRLVLTSEFNPMFFPAGFKRPRR